MIITCTGYSSHMNQNNGKIVLNIDNAEVDPIDDRYGIAEIAELLKKSSKQIQRLSRRKKNPLPLIRGNGRPYAFRTALNNWLLGYNRKLVAAGRFPVAAGDPTLSCIL